MVSYFGSMSKIVRRTSCSVNLCNPSWWYIRSLTNNSAYLHIPGCRIIQKDEYKVRAFKKSRKRVTH